MARPAAGAGRQAQVAGLLLSALVGACAQTGDPPGGPPRTTPAAILRTVPESGAVVPDLHGAAVIRFDEVIDEAPGGASSGGAITGLGQKIVLSPVGGSGVVKVSWHRDAIHVMPAEGWKPNRVYHLEVLPGIADLRRNVTKKGATIVFTTGGAVPTAGLTGTALAWVEQRTLPQAVIRAALLPDTVPYVTLTDSAGNFRLPNIPPGRYRVWAIQDQNGNRRQDRREAFDTATVAVDSTASALLWVFVHDTVGPRVKGVDPVDSVTFRIAFTQSLDPARPCRCGRCSGPGSSTRSRRGPERWRTRSSGCRTHSSDSRTRRIAIRRPARGRPSGRPLLRRAPVERRATPPPPATPHGCASSSRSARFPTIGWSCRSRRHSRPARSTWFACAALT
ncbi:MAG: hypothetical protein E6K55_15970 [Gemmatimonadetes bacterium]|nr:MAG: hypothetical protein E6K55_15970 [Gemmatimonadota bacterium]